jgi:hypothetical protein
MIRIKIIIISLKTQFKDGSSWSLTWINIKLKNFIIIILKLNLGISPGLGSRDKSSWSLTQVNIIIYNIIVIVLKPDFKVNSRLGLDHDSSWPLILLVNIKIKINTIIILKLNSRVDSGQRPDWPLTWVHIKKKIIIFLEFYSMIDLRHYSSYGLSWLLTRVNIKI